VPLPRFVEGELADKPPHFDLVRRGAFDDSAFRGTYPLAGQHRNPPYHDLPEQSVRNARAYYYSMVALIDTQIGRILSHLESSGRLNDTIIVFTTDHGELLGDHGLWLKGPFHYEELVRIPFIVAWPGGFPAGSRVDDLVSQVDVVPTILDAAGAAPLAPSIIDGVSLLDLLRGRRLAKRPAVVVECVDDPAGLRLKTVVTARYKLTHYHGHEFGELYDLEEDPGEARNRWSDPAYAGARSELLGTLVDHAERLERRATRFSYA
jgi:arylsulfatase A-like enzyme